MAAKTYVSVKCEAKDLYDSTLKADLLELMTDTISAAINDKSGGKLTTKAKSDEGFLLTASLTLKADDKKKPTKLDGKLALSVLAIGSTAKAFNGSSSASADRFGSQAKGAAEDVVQGILDAFLPKVIKTMLSL